MAGGRYILAELNEDGVPTAEDESHPPQDSEHEEAKSAQTPITVQYVPIFMYTALCLLFILGSKFFMMNDRSANGGGFLYDEQPKRQYQ